MLSLLFAVQNIASVKATTYAIPISQLFYDAVGPKLAQVCLVVVLLAQVMAAITNFTASSRLFYALARDDAFPLKKQFMALNRFQAPYWGVWVSVLIGCLISCAYIGSAVAVSRPVSSDVFVADKISAFTVQRHLIFSSHISDVELHATYPYSCVLA